MEKRRKLIARIMLVLDVLVCGIWVYLAATSTIRALSGSGSGVSVGGGVLDLAFTVVPPFITIALARASGSTRAARYWRNAHLAVTLALVILPMMAGLRVMMVSIAVFVPVQLFFVVGAVAIWIANARPRSLTPES